MKSSGEVAAIFGYNKQYNVFAVEIYDSLLNNDLEWVELASNDAGKLDDVLIGSKKEIKAYQVKDINGNLTYQKFTDSDTESIFKGCYKGWLYLKEKYPEKKILAKYISNELPSTNDRISKFIGAKTPSFKEFYQLFWNRIKIENLEVDAIPSEWKEVFNELKIKADSSDANLIEFIKSFDFVLNNDYNVYENMLGNNNSQRYRDIEKISKHIFKVVGTQGTTKYEKIQFLKEFGLLSRYETHFKHSFFVDEQHYQPITDTIQKLEFVINNTSKGYIAIIGNAGSGKSTLLTKWLKDRKEKVLRYYAYVNKEMNGEYGYRGEAEIFLKDLIIQIKEYQFSSLENLPSESLPDLQKQLFNELEKFKYEERKVFIIVDGLDHIEREQNVTKSLIDILPKPDEIPDNVYFILGSRTTKNLTNLPERIKIGLEIEGRTIVINPLSLSQIQNLLVSHEIKLTQKQLISISKNTLGHPLFLRYTIEELQKAPKGTYDSLINSKSFNGDIYEEYKIFWNKNKLEDNFLNILGVISRFRYSYVDINLLPNFVNSRADWNKVEQLSEHFFFKKNNIWQFFHNSFKEFLKEETAKSYITNEYDENIDANFHIKIYDVIVNSNADYKWNILFHLFHAKNYDKLLSIATQEFFREQWFDFRNHQHIYDDIKLTSKASYLSNSPKKLFSCILAYYEVSQRINNFNLSNYYKTFHHLNKIDIANSFIFDNTELLVSNVNVLEYGLEIYKKGNHELAFELLKKAEPLYLLNVAKEVSPNRYDRDEMSEIDEVEIIKNWAILASLFYPAKEIFEKISNINIFYDEHRGNDKRNLLIETVKAITDFLIEIEDWDKLNKHYNNISEIPNINLFYFYFDIVWELDNSDKLYELCLKKLKTWYDNTDNPKSRKLALVEIFINKNIDCGKKWFKKLTHPKEITVNDYHLYSTLYYVYDYSRLYYITSKDFDIDSTSLVPNAKKEILFGFYSEFAELGKSSAYIFYGNNEASKGFIFRFKQILGYFNHSVLDFDYEYGIQENKADLINLILNISSKISNDFFNQILFEISTEWKKKAKYWKNKDKQEVIENVINSKINNEWCLIELSLLNNCLFEHGDSHSRIQDGIKQIELWSTVGLVDKGEEILNKLLEISLDINYDDDNQLDYIINWFVEKENIDSKEIEFFIKCLDSVRNKTSIASEYIAKKILTLSLNKSNGFEIFKYLLFEGLVNFNDSLEIVLIYFFNAFPKKENLWIKMFTRIILNFDNDYSYRSTFLNELFKSKVSQSNLNLLVNEINIHCVLEHRHSYLNSIGIYAQENQLEFNETLNKNDDNEKNSNDYSELKLKNGLKIDKEQAIDSMNSYSDIIDLLIQEDKGSYFKWTIPIIKNIERIKKDEIKEIISNKDFSSIELVEIAKAFNEKHNDINFTKELVYEALKKSSSSGWIKHYDGGSKIKPYDLLKKVDSNNNEVNRLIFKDFADNIDVSNSGIISTIHEVLSLIDENFNFNDYYSSIESYKNELLKTHYKESAIPKIESDLNDNDFLNQVIFFLLEFPTGFDDIIFEILIEEFDDNRSLIDTILDYLLTENYEYQFIKLLSVISLKDLIFVKKYENNIVKLLNHSRFDIHRISIRILKRLNIDYKKSFNSNTKEIPLTYKLEFEYKPELVLSEDDRIKRINKTGYLRETNDPIEICNLYKSQIKVLSKETGFKMINIATRIVDLGNKFYKQSNWYENLSEKEIRDIYENKFDLKISYKRPRYQKVWTGLMMVIKELWEIGLLDRGLTNYISNHFDEGIYFIKPQKKPSFISSILKEDNYAPSVSEKWVYELSNEYLNDNLKVVENGFYILAEHSIILGQGDGYTQETRQSFIDFERVDFDGNYIIFEKSYGEFITNYLNVEIEGLCFYNSKLTVNKKMNWLAFNPQIALFMGLKLSEEGVFRWVDKYNTTVIESIFWKNNDDRNRSRNLYSECGYGWYVQITKEGLAKLKELEIYPNYHHQKISRELTFIQNRYNTYIENRNDISNILEISI